MQCGYCFNPVNGGDLPCHWCGERPKPLPGSTRERVLTVSKPRASIPRPSGRITAVKAALSLWACAAGLLALAGMALSESVTIVALLFLAASITAVANLDSRPWAWWLSHAVLGMPLLIVLGFMAAFADEIRGDGCGCVALFAGVVGLMTLGPIALLISEPPGGRA